MRQSSTSRIDVDTITFAIVCWLHRLVTTIRGNWPRVKIMLRADSHYCAPEVLRFCPARQLDYTLGVAPTSTLRKHILDLEESTAARAVLISDGTKLRRFKVFHDWDRVDASSPASRRGFRGSCRCKPSRADDSPDLLA
jgi:hypothetical protein